MARSESKIGRRAFLASVTGSSILMVQDLVAKPADLAPPTKRCLSHSTRLTFCIPAHWSPDRTLRYDYAYSNDFVVSQNLNVIYGHVSSIDHAARLVVSSWLYPDIASVAKHTWRGMDARLISASPDPSSPCSIVFPHPTGSESSGAFYCAITATRGYFASVTATISFDPHLITPELYAESAIDFMESRSLFRDRIDWNHLREQALLAIPPHSAPRYSWEAYPAINMVLDAIKSVGGDIHNRLTVNKRTVRQDMPRTAPGSSGLVIENTIGYLNVPGVSGTAPASASFSESLSELIDQMTDHARSGWIVDLRDNPGGDMYPALWGLLPIMNQGNLLSIHPPTGEATYLSQDRPGMLSLHGVPLSSPMPTSAENSARRAVLLPIAVLVNSNTASAGEAIMLALRSSSASFAFGLPTAGAMTGPSGLSLVDGAELTVSTWWIGSANGGIYPHSYIPDVQFSSDTESSASADDVVTRQAAAWLHSLQQPLRSQ